MRFARSHGGGGEGVMKIDVRAVSGDLPASSPEIFF